MSVAHSLLNTSDVVRPDTLSLLIVDDEQSIREGCREVAIDLGFHTLTAENATAAYKHMDAQTIDVVLLDMKLPGASGLEILHEIKRRRAEAQVIIVTGYATVNSAGQTMKKGANDYITKPFTLDELKSILQRTSGQLQRVPEKAPAREKVAAVKDVSTLIGASEEMEKLFLVISKVARSKHPVLITGESGTGKELVARAIHFSGPYRDKPFIAVDCGSFVPTLIESELFGHVRGAFTGADRPKDGLLAIAEGGTVLLDEIGELPVDLQSKLLRALQEKEIRPVGATKTIPINVRILAATNRDLQIAVDQGGFRKDLFFRLNVVNVRIPALRERKADIPVLVEHFLAKINRASDTQRAVSEEAMRMMMAYDWPGNVRELENCLERCGALSTGPVIHTADLPTQLQNGNGHGPSVGLPMHPTSANGIVPMAEIEKQTILAAMAQLKGDKLMTARMLGIGKTTLYRKLKEYGAE